MGTPSKSWPETKHIFFQKNLEENCLLSKLNIVLAECLLMLVLVPLPKLWIIMLLLILCMVNNNYCELRFLAKWKEKKLIVRNTKHSLSSFCCMIQKRNY